MDLSKVFEKLYKYGFRDKLDSWLIKVNNMRSKPEIITCGVSSRRGQYWDPYDL